MKLREFLNLKNIGILEFNILFLNLEKSLLDDLFQYKLINNNKLDVGNSDTKKLILHHLIYNICEAIIKHKGKRSLILVDYKKNLQLTTTEIIKYTDYDPLCELLVDTLKQISRMLPIPVMFISDDIFEMDNNDGEVMEFKCVLFSKLHELDNKSYSFRKIKRYCNTNGLTFLTSEYFNNINTQQIMM